MILYHGTVDAYLPEIEKEGLRYTPEHGYKDAYAAHPRYGLSPTPMEAEPGVYLTNKKQVAENFAQYKAAWLMSPSGLVMNGPKDTDQSFHLFKMTATPIINTEPVILTLAIPEEIADKIEPDPESDATVLGAMLFYRGSIPATAIKAVSHLSLKPLYRDPDLERINKLLLEHWRERWSI